MNPPSFPLTVTEPGRADAVLAAALDGLTRSAAQRPKVFLKKPFTMR